MESYHPIDWKKLFSFVGLAYGLCWAVAFTYFGLGGRVGSPWFTVVAAGCMLTPAIAAVIVQRGLYRRPLAEIGLVWRMNRWMVVAWLLPLALVGGAILLSALVPDASLSFGESAFSRQLAALPPEEAELARRQLDQLGPALPFIIVGAGLVFGPTVNAVFALGEELGWRGLMQRELAPLGFWRASLGIGVVWGLWHAPLIVHGYNYPEHPVAGVFMMTGLTVLLAPIMAYVRLRAGTVLAAAVLHGVFNAVAGLSLLLVEGGSELTVGMTGAAGFGALLLANLGVFLHQRHHSVAKAI